jgi:hypothetical protein
MYAINICLDDSYARFGNELFHLTVKRSSLERSNLDHIFYGFQIRPIAIDLSLV